MIVFDFNDYHDFLHYQIKDNSDVRGYLTQLAKAAECQKSYLSQVIKGRVHFTPEHATKLTLFWNLNDSESEYFIQLVHLGRTSFMPLIKKIRFRLKEIKSTRENFAQRFQQESVPSIEAQSSYYSSWIPGAIHVIVDIEKYRTLEAIATRLALPPNLVKSHLEILMSLGLVIKQGAQWLPTGKNIHLPKASMFTVVNHQNWKSRALLDCQMSDTAGVHYSAIQTLSTNDYENLKDLLLGFIDQQRKTIEPSKPEEIVCFTCDWFKI